MTCDYDNDRFNQGLKLQHPMETVIVIVNDHSQKVSWSSVKYVT